MNFNITAFITIFFLLFSSCEESEKPRVFIFTDINIDSGDPDDRQSLVHLLWYADELEIEGIIIDRPEAGGMEACRQVTDAYKEDFDNYKWGEKGFPSPERINQIYYSDPEVYEEKFRRAASLGEKPLYVLVWGNMLSLSAILDHHPELTGNIRLITIGTGLMPESSIQYLPDSWEKSPPCEQMNWNSPGRNMVFSDPRFKKMWWLEINWTYEGMFYGDEPSTMLQNLSGFGAMGRHIKDVVKKESWARYFRVGDTPSVLYLIDQKHDPNDPLQSSWAGKFSRPFPEERPGYYTDFTANSGWDISKPCETWSFQEVAMETATQTLIERRSEMYASLLDKLEKLYREN